MDKNSIKKYAVWARQELIERVRQKAAQYGVTEEETVPADAQSIGGKLLSSMVIEQRKALIRQIESKGYWEVMEEVAYTWFNRFMALRYMEVNEYLPSRVRVFTDADNAFHPQILAEAIDLDLESLDLEKVYALKNANDQEALYKYLLITQCNVLSPVLPGMFQQIADYTELLLPDNLLREGSVIEKMVTMIPEKDWKNQVQIIGWLYQYYNSEKKDDVFAALKKNVKITKENIPAATQLFTPDWIVRYMVENSLGRLWLEGHPEARERRLPTKEEQAAFAAGARDEKDPKWHYYLEGAAQEPEVQAQLAEIHREYAKLKPEEIKVIDPCCGSGHVLVYMFEVLMQIYEDYGYVPRAAVESILEHNLYGLDIDDRAAQQAYFAVMMIAVKYDPRFLRRKDADGRPYTPQPHVYAVCESGRLDQNGKLYRCYDEHTLAYFCNGDPERKAAMDTILRELFDAKEYGSILTVTDQNWNALYDRFDAIFDEGSLEGSLAWKNLLPLVRVAEALAQKYDVVVTNPPYMKTDSMPIHLATYIFEKWETAKYDLYAAFIYRAYSLLKKDRLAALITMHNFMYSPSFLDMRMQIVHWDWLQLLHLGTHAFSEIGGEVVQTVAFVLSNSHVKRNLAVCDLTGLKDADAKEKAFCQHIAPTYKFNLEKTRSIPNHAFGYALSEIILDFYDKQSTLESKCVSKAGVVTGNDDFFCKLWFEVNLSDITFLPDIHKLYKYVPFSRGGSFSSWYGNTHHVLRVEDMYNDKLTNKSVRRGDIEFYYRTGIGWSQMGGGINKNFSIIENSICKTTTPMIYCANEDELLLILGYLNSPIPSMVLKSLNPTLSILTSDILHLPYIPITYNCTKPIEDVKTCIHLSCEDSNSYETSWDFKRNPLV